MNSIPISSVLQMATPDYIKRLAKLIHSELGITDDAVQYLVNLTALVQQRIEDATELRATQVDTLKAKILAVLPGSLGKAAVQAARTVVEVKLNKVSEYIVREILDLAGNSARDSGRKNIALQDIDRVIANDEELYEVFKKDMVIPLYVIAPNIPAAGINRSNERKRVTFNTTHTRNRILRDLKATLGDRPISKSVLALCANAIRHIQVLFGTVDAEQYAKWLDSLPTQDSSSNLNEQCYREVLGLIAAGIIAVAPKGPINYAVLTYALGANPYYDLAKYLNSKTLE